MHLRSRDRDRLSGQASVEYILMLLVAALLAILVVRQFIIPTGKYLSDRLSQMMTAKLFNPDKMHSIRISR